LAGGFGDESVRIWKIDSSDSFQIEDDNKKCLYHNSDQEAGVFQVKLFDNGSKLKRASISSYDDELQP